MTQKGNAVAALASRAAVRGLDAEKKTVFELRREGAQLALAPGAGDFKKVSLLVFLDPEAAEERWLFVLPVLRDSFDLDDKGSGVFELEGSMRSFIVPEPSTFGEKHGWSDFELEVAAAPAGAALLRFRRINIGQPSAKNIDCDKATLINTALTYADGFVADKPRYADAGLLNLFRANGTDVQKHNWNRSVRFIAPPEVSEEKPHAALVFECSAEFPLSDKGQRVPPFGLDYAGAELPLRGGGALPVIHYMLFRQRLPWGADFEPSAGVLWLLRLSVPQSGVFESWNEGVLRPVTGAVSLIEAGRPLTTLPHLSNDPGADRTNAQVWDAWFTFVDRSPDKELKKDDYGAGSIKGAGAGKDGIVTIIPRRVTPKLTQEPNPLPVERQPIAVAVFPAIKSHSGEPLLGSFDCLTLPFKSEADYTTDEGQGIAFRLRQRTPVAEEDAPVPQPVRMGALDLNFLPAARKKGDKQGPVDLGATEFGSVHEAWWETEPDNSFQAVRVNYRSARLIVGVGTAAPGGEDDVAGEEYVEDLDVDEGARGDVELLSRRRPLALPLVAQTGDAWDARYRLEMSELIDAKRTQTIDFKLFELRIDPDPVESRILIIDPQPWLVTLVKAPPLSALDADLTTEVANWTNRANLGARWQVQSQALVFELVLPPQVVGEAMHRRREDADVVPGTAADFRFSPPAYIRLQQTRGPQRSAEPGWNLRRITESALAPSIIEAGFELLYGMWGRLRARNLLLSEVGARLGSFPSVQSAALPWPATKEEKVVYQQTRQVWLGILGGLRTRLAVLEPWSPAQQSLVLTQDDGLQFRLRDSAALQYPVPGEPPPLPSTNQPPRYFVTDPKDPRFPGLKGGWSWGFESRNVLGAVSRDPNSYAATLTEFYLSSMGAWGQQRVAFDRGLSTVISRVEMGRASTIVIERIGRIGVFWNRAKHVIVYERTVAASRQFYLEQYALTGNPVLRKVDEYIEILEPERAFPEKNSPAAARGFVVGCRFADGEPPRIRVNSRWGQDIGDTGWKIPLWVRGALPADVYPKPTIFVLGAGAGEERVPVAHDDPDKLYFYTNTDPSLGVDTDTWPAVEGVDFQAVDPAWLSPPAFIEGEVTSDPDGYNKTDAPVREGVGAFTFRMQPAPAPVNYVAGRAEKAVRAVPQTLTVMRGAIVEQVKNAPPAGVPPEAVVAARELRTHVENAFSAFVAADPIKDFPEALKQFDAAFNQVTSAYKDALRAVADGTQVCEKIQKRVSNQFRQFAQQTKLEALSALHFFEQQFRTLAKEVFPVADLEELKAKLSDALDSVAQDTGGARAQLRAVRGLPGEAAKKIALLCDELRTMNVRVSDAFAEASARIASLDDWTKIPDPAGALAEAREALDKLLETSAVRDAIARSGVDYRLAEIARTWLGSLPDKARIRLDEKRRQYAQALAEVEAKLSTTGRDEVVSALRKAADDIFKTLVTLIALLKDEWLPVFAQDEEEPWPLEGALDDFVRRCRDAIEALNSVDPAMLKQALERTAVSFYTDLDGRLDALIEQSGASEAAGALAKKVCDSVVALKAELEGYLGRVLNNERLKELAKLAAGDAATLLRGVDEVLTGMLGDIDALVSRVRVAVPELPLPNARTLPDDVLRLCRSFGNAPELPNLKFHVPHIGYYFFAFDKAGELPSLLPTISLSPVAAAANKVKDDLLNSLNLSVPVDKLLERLVPADLRNFDLSKVVPHIAGLDLSRLFRAVRLPSMANEGVRVTHGLDEATRSGWLEVDVNVTYQQKLTVFDIAGVRLELLRANFTATTRVEFALGQQARQRASGAIRGDWSLTAGGFALVDFKDCTLQFDEGGHIRFDVSPTKVRLKPPLDFLSDLLEPFGGSKNGFHVAVTPSGVQTSLFLPVPNIQAGSFGIANLVLGFTFGLDILPKFRLRSALSIGRPDHPFTFTVFILGGAGYFSYGLSYTPATGELGMALSVAIYASASLAISLGVISGGIYAYFGIQVDYETSNRGGSNLAVTLKLIFTGEVCVLGFITVGLTMGLEAGYDSQRNLTGRGYVSISIKIGWFIDITVNADISYTFGKGTTTSSSTSIQTAADSYVDMF